MNQPIAGVRVIRLDGEYLINPSMEQTKNSDIQLVVAGSVDGICMVEGGGSEADEASMMEAMDLAFVEIKKIIAAIEELKEKARKNKKRDPDHNPDLIPFKVSPTYAVNQHQKGLFYSFHEFR